jgi:hypothetical protein
MAVQFGGTYASVRRSAPLFITIVFATLFFGTALNLVDADNTLSAIVLGASLLLAAVGVDRTEHRGITPVLYLFGSMMFLYGYFDLVDNSVVEPSFLGVAAAFVYLSAALHSRMLLFIATTSILGYTARFTQDHFADSVGWPIALIAFGMFMIGLSALAVRFDRDYVRRASDRLA